MAIPVNVSGLRRNIKNIAHNYTDAQVKVREATSNDPWGPSSTIMSEIADLTYNVVAFSEIMQMVWKRLNDHGKNWRHVYKALVLLEYLIKTGTEKVADQSRENIHSISTLKDFQYLEEGKDQGINVREKAKSMVALLKDDERLRNERVRALKAKERFAQSVSGIASDADINSPTSPSYHDTFATTTTARPERDAAYKGGREAATTDYGELESARPHTLGEEELQLQLALAMSKEEADHEEAGGRSDDVRLQMALTESKDDKDVPSGTRDRQQHPKQDQEERSGINDLLDINFNMPRDGSSLGAVGGMGLGSPVSPPAPSRDPWGLSPPSSTQPTNGLADPWGGIGVPSLPTSPPNVTSDTNGALNDPWAPPPPPPPQPQHTTGNDPWAPAPPPPADPWGPAKSSSPVVMGGASPPPPQADPFAPLPQKPALDEFSALTNREKPANSDMGAFALATLDSVLAPTQQQAAASPAKSRSPAAFLGENSNLVNLDNLVASKSSAGGGTPHGMAATASVLSTSSPNLNDLLSTSSAFPSHISPLAVSANSINDSYNVNINNNNNNNTNPFGSYASTTNKNNTAGVDFTSTLNSDMTAKSLMNAPISIHKSYSPLPTAYSPLPTAYSPLPTAYSPHPTSYTPVVPCYSPVNSGGTLLPLSQASFAGANPFSGGVQTMGGAPPAAGVVGTGGGVVPNPFQAAQSPKPSINQLRGTAAGSNTLLGGPVPGPWGPSPLDAANNAHINDPFML